MSYLLEETPNIPYFIREQILKISNMYSFHCPCTVARVSTEHSPHKILSIYKAQELYIPNPAQNSDNKYFCTISVRCTHCNTEYTLILSVCHNTFSNQFLSIGNPIFVNSEALNTILSCKNQLVPIPTTPTYSCATYTDNFINILISNYILLTSYQHPQYYKQLREILLEHSYSKLHNHCTHILPPQYRSPIIFLQSLKPRYWTEVGQFIIKYLKLPYNRFTKLYSPVHYKPLDIFPM